VASLASRLQRLEDLEAIKDVAAQYALLCDNGYDADRLADLFTDDAVWENPVFGNYEGKEAIRAFFSGISASIVWAYHIMLPMTISIASDGRSATGTWYALSLSTQTARTEPGGFDAVIATADLEKQLVKEGGDWRIRHAKASMHQVSNIDEGWVAQRFRTDVNEAIE
jgi:uncharacterized protein (TIGR02246 family)